MCAKNPSPVLPKLRPWQDGIFLVLTLVFGSFAFVPIHWSALAVCVGAAVAVMGRKGWASAFPPLRNGRNWLWGFLLPAALLIGGGFLLAGSGGSADVASDRTFLSIYGLVLVLSALGEELAIRVGLFRLLINRLSFPLWAAALVSSAIFGLLHLPQQGWGASALTFAGGLIYCASYRLGRSFLFPVLLHITNNLFYFLQ